MLKTYEELLKRNILKFDIKQSKVVEILDNLSSNINKSNLPLSCKGLYLFGGSGSGKTMLMDMFYNSLKTNHKSRYHWDCFIEDIHNKLYKFDKSNNSIDEIAKYMSDKNRIICVDEIQKSDIATYKILSNVLKNLFNYNIIFIATSNRDINNIIPDSILNSKYSNINCLSNIIENNCLIHDIDSYHDYRFTYSKSKSKFYSNINKEDFIEIFKNSCGNTKNIGNIELQLLSGRILNIANSSLTPPYNCLFNATDLFDSIMGSSDFRAICEKYSNIFIYNITKFYPIENPNPTRRFISFIDSAYDCKCRIYLSCDTNLNELFYTESLNDTNYESDESFAISRTISRLNEMLSESFITKN